MEEFDPGDEGYWKMKDFENYSKSYGCNCKLGRIWSNGVKLGKKMVITGVLVSSAPFVLPSIVALSAIGVAFSVPAGFVLATYACGEKVMNTLLPMPSSTPYFENESMYGYEEDYRVYRDDIDKGYESDDDLDVEEQKIEADIRKGLETRIELVEENDKQFDNYDEMIFNKDELDERSSKMSEIVQEEILETENGMSFMKKEEGCLPRVSEGVEEGYKEDIGEYMEDEEPPLDEKEIPGILEGIKEAESEISLMEEDEGGMLRDSLRSAVVTAQGGENEMNVEQVMEDTAVVPQRDIKEENVFAGIEEDKLEDERIKLIEEMRDEVENDQNRKESKDSSVKETPDDSCKSGINQEVESIMDDWGVKTDSKSENNVEQVTKDVAYIPTRDTDEKNGFSGINQEELRSETTGLIEKIRDEGRDDRKRKENPAKETPEVNETNVVQVTEDVALLDIQEGNGFAVVEEEEPQDETTRLNDKDTIFDLKGEANTFEDTSIQQDEPKSGVESQVVVNVKIDGDHTVTEFHQGTGSDKLGNLILSNEDTEMTAEGEDQSLTVDYNEIATEPTMPVSGILDKGQSLNDLVEVTVDYHEVVIESAMFLSETSKDQGTAAGYKVKQEEEKLWEQINAMRTIVGYTNTPHLTCAEELKALYDFTGVELPISSNDPTDLVDINEKLHLLMSIIGVK